MESARLKQKYDYDLIAIGSGPASESATELAAFFGQHCLIIEKDSPGGTVTTTGGVPTKTLREAALYVSGYRDRDLYGLGLESPPQVMLDVVRRRTRAVSKSLQELTYQNIRARGVDYLHGYARLQDERSVQVETTDGRSLILRARVLLIATGSRPSIPLALIPVNHPGICDSDTILRRGRPPKDLLIVGGGAVAVEFATIARALNINVTIVSLGECLLTSMDAEIATRLTTTMAACGVHFLPSTTLRSVTPRGDLLAVTLTSGRYLQVDTILFAAGRVGQTEGFGLEEVGVVCTAKGRIRVDRNFQTSVPGVYAAGDVVEPTLASVAMEQGRRAVCHAFRIPVSDKAIDLTPVSAVYSMPEVACVGLTEEQCLAEGVSYEVGRVELAETPRGAIAGRGGLLKLIFQKHDRKVIGVHCLGDIASELVGVGQMAIKLGGTIHTFATMTINTPTYQYAYKYAAFDGLRRLLRASKKAM